MRATIDSKRLTRARRVRPLIVAILVTGVVVAGCGSSSGGPTTSASSVASSRSTEARASVPAPLAFARCMRANGVTSFPDPKAGGGFAFHASAGIISSPAFRAAQAKCGKLIGGGPPIPGSTTHPSVQTLAKLLKIAQCMRRHGVPQFPDPRTSIPSNPSGIQEITDFDGAILLFPSTLNLQSPAYKQALTACGAPPFGLPH